MTPEMTAAIRLRYDADCAKMDRTFGGKSHRYDEVVAELGEPDFVYDGCPIWSAQQTIITPDENLQWHIDAQPANGIGQPFLLSEADRKRIFDA